MVVKPERKAQRIEAWAEIRARGGYRYLYHRKLSSFAAALAAG
jgi:hypothetical protein